MTLVQPALNAKRQSKVTPRVIILSDRGTKLPAIFMPDIRKEIFSYDYSCVGFVHFAILFKARAAVVTKPTVQ